MEAPSIFDGLEGKKYPFFWKKILIDIEERRKQIPVIFEDEMLRKSYRSNELYKRKYIFFEDILVKPDVIYLFHDNNNLVKGLRRITRKKICRLKDYSSSGNQLDWT